ncbi:MAG: hypothetical protein WDN23_20005 [Edaphobacter sp.]
MIRRSFFPNTRATSMAALAVAGLILSSLSAVAQVTGTQTTNATGQQQQTVNISSPADKKADKVVQSQGHQEGDGEGEKDRTPSTPAFPTRSSTTRPSTLPRAATTTSPRLDPPDPPQQPIPTRNI